MLLHATNTDRVMMQADHCADTENYVGIMEVTQPQRHKTKTLMRKEVKDKKKRDKGLW